MQPLNEGSGAAFLFRADTRREGPCLMCTKQIHCTPGIRYASRKGGTGQQSSFTQRVSKKTTARIIRPNSSSTH